MKKPPIELVFLLLFTAGIAASCRKNKTTSVHDEIVGKWEIASVAYDKNGNGIPDANEMYADSSTTFYTFYSDGSGKLTDLQDTSHYTEDDSTFHWVLLYNNTYLRIMRQMGTPVDYDTITVHLDALSVSNMTWRDSTESPPWIFLVKH